MSFWKGRDDAVVVKVCWIDANNNSDNHTPKDIPNIRVGIETVSYAELVRYTTEGVVIATDEDIDGDRRHVHTVPACMIRGVFDVVTGKRLTPEKGA